MFFLIDCELTALPLPTNPTPEDAPQAVAYIMNAWGLDPRTLMQLNVDVGVRSLCLLGSS